MASAQALRRSTRRVKDPKMPTSAPSASSSIPAMESVAHGLGVATDLDVKPDLGQLSKATIGSMSGDMAGGMKKNDSVMRGGKRIRKSSTTRQSRKKVKIETDLVKEEDAGIIKVKEKREEHTETQVLDSWSKAGSDGIAPDFEGRREAGLEGMEAGPSPFIMPYYKAEDTKPIRHPGTNSSSTIPMNTPDHPSELASTLGPSTSSEKVRNLDSAGRTSQSKGKGKMKNMSEESEEKRPAR